MTGSALSLVGRTREQREMDARLSLAERGVGGLVLLAGEAGIGKTALAEHAALDATRPCSWLARGARGRDT